MSNKQPIASGIAKVPTGIAGLDEVLHGGLPRARPTLVCGGAGCGKTLLAMEFLCHGARDSAEPGVFVAFEEKAGELAANMASLGFDLESMQREGKLLIDYVPVDPQQVVETGEYDLEGLFIRLASAVAGIGAKRIAIDTIEVLFGALSDTATVRAELKRLFSWLKDQGLTAVITAERGDGDRISRNGIEEYVSDCVVLLDHRVEDQHSTRRLRVVKYRGSLHGTDEYPFVISGKGFVVLPITSIGLGQEAPTERLSTGIPRLDDTLSGGVYRASSVLISGSSGTGKTIMAAHFAQAACQRGERALFISYEESASQIERNMRSVGIDLAPWREAGLLRVEAIRPTFYSLETHLTWVQQLLDDFGPALIVLDPVTSFLRLGTGAQTSSMLMREIDMLKSSGLSAVFTALNQAGSLEEAHLDVSSLIDTWLVTETLETNGERNRVLYIIKSRGMAHSNQLAEFTIGEGGIELLEPYVGPGGVLTGSARVVQEAADRAAEAELAHEVEDRRRALEQREAAVEAQVAALRAGFAADAAQLERFRATKDQDLAERSRRSSLMGARRWASGASPSSGGEL